MPKPGEEIYLTEVEVDIMRVFFDHLYLTDQEIASELRVLADKLTGNYGKETKKS